jgi:hypothetical protein
MNKTRTVVATAILVIGTSASGAAQSDTDLAAFMGIQSTPVGALPPVITGGTSSKRMSFHAGFGHTAFEGQDAINTVGGGVTLPFRNAHVSLTAAYSMHSCPPADCESHFMLGANWNRTVLGMVLGSGNDRAALRVGVDAGLGYGQPNYDVDLSESAWSAGLGLPISLTSGGPGMQVSPFVVPRFAYGRYSIEGAEGESGTSLMLGGGLAITGLYPKLGINIGFQKTFVDGMPTQYGVGLSWR